MKVDVLAAIDSALEETEGTSAHGPLMDARDAIAELIEADEYFDDSQYGLARARYNGEPIKGYAQDLAKADIRRAIAIASVKGAA